MSDQETSIECISFEPSADAEDICNYCVGSVGTKPLSIPCYLGGTCKFDEPINLEDHR